MRQGEQPKPGYHPKVGWSSIRCWIIKDCLATTDWQSAGFGSGQGGLRNVPAPRGTAYTDMTIHGGLDVVTTVIAGLARGTARRTASRRLRGIRVKKPHIP
jgi:hypothetical protein